MGLRVSGGNGGCGRKRVTALEGWGKKMVEGVGGRGCWGFGGWG